MSYTLFFKVGSPKIYHQKIPMLFISRFLEALLARTLLSGSGSPGWLPNQSLLTGKDGRLRWIIYPPFHGIMVYIFHKLKVGEILDTSHWMPHRSMFQNCCFQVDLHKCTETTSRGWILSGLKGSEKKGWKLRR